MFVNAAIYDHCPDLPSAAHRRGDETVGHGLTHSERQSTFDEDGERRLIEETTAAIRRTDGRALVGWLEQWIVESRSTPDLLEVNGYRRFLSGTAPLDQTFAVRDPHRNVGITERSRSN